MLLRWFYYYFVDDVFFGCDQDGGDFPGWIKKSISDRITYACYYGIALKCGMKNNVEQS